MNVWIYLGIGHLAMTYHEPQTLVSVFSCKTSEQNIPVKNRPEQTVTLHAESLICTATTAFDWPQRFLVRLQQSSFTPLVL